MHELYFFLFGDTTAPRCRTGIVQEVEALVSGRREQEQPLLECILLRAVFFVNSIDQCPSVSGIIVEKGELVSERGGRERSSHYSPLPSAASPDVSFALA